ncbi:hypothetical protein LZ480_07790 [Solibacillus sp. MA9]|uniref:Uncharacterized protein n=1 Tax=Solibacillus palustris TaxID=2908203 RepID=A0ABS9UBT9_9BACL|nr:hypothetical protein [Solibacillus sp. MA9]MCH7321794.1 hypothetical protein [Solibacillus sp. MA9]
MSTELQPIAISSMIDFLDANTVKAKVIIDGNTYEKEISHVSRTYGLRKYVKFTTERGTVTRVALIDSHGREWYVKTMNYTIGSQGYVVAFPFELEIISKVGV